MSKPVRERKIDSPTARESGKPYWRLVDIGLHIGYRKGQRGGRGVMRRYAGKETYVVETVGTADENQDADGNTILTFFQAQKQGPRTG